jgi:hypothetical protein
LSCPKRQRSGQGYDERGILNLLLAGLDVGADLFNNWQSISFNLWKENAWVF